MFEKVNPAHPDKLADRVAGAIVDLAYRRNRNPHIAVEVLLGHGHAHIIAESSVVIPRIDVEGAVARIVPVPVEVDYLETRQDPILAGNQMRDIACGDNGIFKGLPVTEEQRRLARIARDLYRDFPFDGKYILSHDRLIICQSNAHHEDLAELYPDATINPLGFWTGGIGVDTGATNRKLGSDMADAVTGGGLHGKDLSKADVSLNIYAHLKAELTGGPVQIYCAIGDTRIDGRPYSEIVEIARNFINQRGGFERFAEWGLI